MRRILNTTILKVSLIKPICYLRLFLLSPEAEFIYTVNSINLFQDIASSHVTRAMQMVLKDHTVVSSTVKCSHGKLAGKVYKYLSCFCYFSFANQARIYS